MRRHESDGTDGMNGIGWDRLGGCLGLGIAEAFFSGGGGQASAVF